MQRSTLAMVFLLTLAACGEPGTYGSISDETRKTLSVLAGKTARYAVLHPSDASRPAAPTDEELSELYAACKSRPEAWSYFFSCVAESTGSIEPPPPTCRTHDIQGYTEEDIGAPGPAGN